MPALRGREAAAFFFLSILWSGNWLLIKIGLESLPPLRFAGLRMALAFLLLAPLAWRRARGGLTAVEARWVALVGFLQIGVSYACVFTAEQWIESGLAALLFASFAIWIGVIGHFLLPGEPLTARTLAATALGIAGVAVIEGPALARASSAAFGPLALGGFLVIVSAIVSALSAVLIKKRLSRVSPLVNVWGQAIVSAAFLLAASELFERGMPSRWSFSSGGALLYLSVVGTFTFLGTQWLVPRVPVEVIGSFPILNTLLALLWGGLLGHERFTTRVFAGGILILCGVLLVTVGCGIRSANGGRELSKPEPSPPAGPS